MELIPATFTCASCWQTNETTVDPSAGARQTYVEDCQVCCRPMVLRVTVSDDEAVIEAEAEAE